VTPVAPSVRLAAVAEGSDGEGDPDHRQLKGSAVSNSGEMDAIIVDSDPEG